MTLSDLWADSPEQLSEKHVRQVMAFCGSGKLRDGSDASTEFRAFLSRIPSKILRRYADECLTEAMEDGGYVLQDIVNEVGRRLGFQVTDGRYQGTTAHVGFDGLWRFDDSRVLLVEVKTTDAYAINLDRVADYRRTLIERKELLEEGSSILMVVGRKDTGSLEAQIRGSRHAWDVRLISVDSLLRLMVLKESLEGPETLRKVREVLVPHEFTRLDGIIELVFSTAEDVADVEPDEESAETEGPERGAEESKPAFVPVAFNDACADRVQRFLSQPLVRRSKAKYSSPDEATRVVCAVSKEHSARGYSAFWFAFHPHQKEFLEVATRGYVAYGCGAATTIFLIPFADFRLWLDRLNVTVVESRTYWHIHIHNQDGRYSLVTKAGGERIDLTRYLLPA